MSLYRSFLLKALVVLLSFCYLLPSSLAAETVVVHHPELNKEEISTGALLRIYAMKKKSWDDGTPITVYVLPKSHETHQDFVTQHLKVQPHQLNRLWHKLVFSGTGTKPEVVVSFEEMLEKVSSTPGAIGYVDNSQIDIDPSLLFEEVIHE